MVLHMTNNATGSGMGDSRSGGTDHDMADDDPDRVRTDGSDQNITDPDRTSGSRDTWYFGIHEKERLD